MQERGERLERSQEPTQNPVACFSAYFRDVRSAEGGVRSLRNGEGGHASAADQVPVGAKLIRACRLRQRHLTKDTSNPRRCSGFQVRLAQEHCTNNTTGQPLLSTLPVPLHTPHTTHHTHHRHHTPHTPHTPHTQHNTRNSTHATHATHATRHIPDTTHHTPGHITDTPQTHHIHESRTFWSTGKAMNAQTSHEVWIPGGWWSLMLILEENSEGC